VLWSLSVEEQFYWIWPVLLWSVPKRYVLKTMLGVIGFALAWRVLGYYVLFPGSRYAQEYATLSCLDLFAAGGLLAYGVRRFGTVEELHGWLRATKWFRPLIVLTLGAYVCYVQYVYQWFGAGELVDPLLRRGIPIQHTLDAGFWLLVVFYLALGNKGWVGKFLETRAMQYLGTISYALYLIHLAVFFAVRPAIAWVSNYLGCAAAPQSLLQGMVNVTMVLIPVLCLCEGIRRVLEEPMGKLAKRLPYSVNS
jgi:peptidoglycan/LPS O-acetylase OafA/YrhL